MAFCPVTLYWICGVNVLIMLLNSGKGVDIFPSIYNSFTYMNYNAIVNVSVLLMIYYYVITIYI